MPGTEAVSPHELDASSDGVGDWDCALDVLACWFCDRSEELWLLLKIKGASGRTKYCLTPTI